MAYHKLTVIGKLVGDVRVNESRNGKIAHFGLPINFTRPKKNPETGKWEGESFIINVDVFDRENYKLAEIVSRSLKKGSQVYVEGRLRNNTYKNQSGVEVTTMVLVADVIEFLDGRPEGMGDDMGGSMTRAAKPAATPGRAPVSVRSDFDDEPEMEPAPRRGGAMGGGDESEIPF